MTWLNSRQLKCEKFVNQVIHSKLGLPQNLINMNRLRMSLRRLSKITAYHRGTEKVLWNSWSYKIIEMVGTNASTSKKHNFYNSRVQAISKRGVVLIPKAPLLIRLLNLSLQLLPLQLNHRTPESKPIKKIVFIKGYCEWK